MPRKTAKNREKRGENRQKCHENAKNARKFREKTDPRRSCRDVGKSLKSDKKYSEKCKKSKIIQLPKNPYKT
jgi:hypothetical protein